MSILNINTSSDYNLVKDVPENITYNAELKELYGEIHTPYWFIQKMYTIIPECHFKNKELKWLDAGAGHGNYSICLFVILFHSLIAIIPDDNERKEHIIKNMIYMVEYNIDNVSLLRKTFGENGNIIHGDYIEWQTPIQFDFIIGNPPYNCNGIKKVPTKYDKDKKLDGKTIWTDFVKKNLSLLKDDGKMCVLIPSIWMKPDKAGMYELMLQYNIERLHTLNSSEVNKLFGYHVQTPICYFILSKRENKNKIKQIELYDDLKKDYISFVYKSELTPFLPIPLCFGSIVNKMLQVTNIYGKLNVIKTNMPGKNIHLNDTSNDLYPYKNIRTTLLDKNKDPRIQIQYSNEKTLYHDHPKIIMAHKMYGFPYLDKEGEYGISTRDNYVVLDKSLTDMELIVEFLSTDLILFLYETTRYRMRYLEKYVFEYIPDFTKIPSAIQMYNNNRTRTHGDSSVNIYKIFGIDKKEQQFIERYYNIKYGRCANTINST
jgi:hypothetical protein